MNRFSKYIVKTKETCESILKHKIGNSIEYMSDYVKYPSEFPSLLIIDEETGNFEYIYRSIFD